jgi:bifunctional enzyme CysN/CysC
MSHQSDLIATDIDTYLAQHERKELLRFLTCGSVDDGKSTLIGKLLYDSKMIYEDQLAAVKRDSAVHGTTDGEFDPALLTDGLKAEREQGITIDVAYRYFSTAKRKFIIADTPGHEQYTRNMATGASTCDLAIILIDARHGVVTQTKRHSFITSLLGIKHILVAINKMDLVDYSQEVYESIKEDYTDFSARMGVTDIHFLPISALKGDNVVQKSDNMGWYDGSTLMHMLDNVHIAADRNLIDFRFPVQYVNRPNLDFRGFCGTIASGVVRVGDTIMALPSRKTSRIKSIIACKGANDTNVLEQAFPPLSITLTLEDEIDVSRGDTLVHAGNVPQVSAKFDAMVVWMDENRMVPGKQYLLKQANKVTPGSIATLRYQIDVNTLHRQDAPTLSLNEIGRCEVKVNEALIFDAYRKNRATGAFILIDRLTNRTVAAGMILDRSADSKGADHWDDEPQSATLKEAAGKVSREERAARFGQKPATILFTGLSGSGKSTTAYGVERALFEQGRAVTVLDGQNMRLGISKDLGFTADERSENLRRSCEVAKLVNDTGMICLAAFVAPNETIRQKVRELIGNDHFFLVHLSAPLELCRQRDNEGMYEAAERGEIANFPGVSSSYETPENADLVLETDKLSVEACVQQVMDLMQSKQLI